MSVFYYQAPRQLIGIGVGFVGGGERAALRTGSESTMCEYNLLFSTVVSWYNAN